VLSEWVLAVAALLISVVFLYLTQSFPVLQADPGGTALVPRVAATATAVAAVLLIVRLIRRTMQARDAGPAAIRAAAGPEPGEARWLARRTIYVVAFSIAFPFAILELGLVVGSILYTFALMKLYKTSPLTSIVTSCAIGIGLYVFFVVLIGANAPPGRLTGAVLERLFE
jgi:hypothetical protein